MKSAVIIPCYKVESKIEQVVTRIPNDIDFIILVDDCCPRNSLEVIRSHASNSDRIHILHRAVNGGVGAATLDGYKKAVELGAEVLIKMDGDDQMNPEYLPSLIEPIKNKKCDYAKGNRFTSQEILKQMPFVRLLGNSGLSFLVKATSGYWNVMDPTNGFTAMSSEVFNTIKNRKISKRYFFEIDLLCNLYYEKAVVYDIPMHAKYEDENSSLNVFGSLLSFPPKLFKRFLKRVFLQYFVFDFNVATLYMIFGIPMFLWGLFFGLSKWYLSFKTGEPRPVGDVMLAALPIIISFNLLLHAIQVDLANVPRARR